MAKQKRSTLAISTVNDEAKKINETKSKKMMKVKIKKSVANIANHSRCNLGAMLNLVTELHNKIRMEHLEVLTKTPFGQFFKLFYELKLNKKDIMKTSSNVTELIRTYSEERDAFKLGGEWVELTVDDVALTFGLPKRGRKVSVQQKNVMKDMQSEFICRQFRGVEILKKGAIAEAIKRTVATIGKTAEEDFARLVILYMAVTIFFPNSGGTIGWGFVKHIEDLKSLNCISWAAVVHDHLMNIVKKHHRKALQVPGCVIQVLFWFCEHVEIISPIKGFESVLPRIARWSLYDLGRAMEKQSLEALPQEKVSIELKKISTYEKDLLKLEVDGEEDMSIGADMNAIVNIEVDDEREKSISEDTEGIVEPEVDDEGDTSISTDVNSIVKLEVNDERDKIISSYEGDEMQQKEEEGEFQKLMKENLRLENENIQLAVKCKELEAKVGRLTRATDNCISVSEEGICKSISTDVDVIVELEMDDERGKNISSYEGDEMQQEEEDVRKENHQLENENFQFSVRCKELEEKVRRLTRATNNSTTMSEEVKDKLEDETLLLKFFGEEGEENDHKWQEDKQPASILEVDGGAELDDKVQGKHNNKEIKEQPYKTLQQGDDKTDENEPITSHAVRLKAKKRVRNEDPEFKRDLRKKESKKKKMSCKGIKEEPIDVESFHSPMQDFKEQLPDLKFSKVFDYLDLDQQEVVTTFFKNADTSTVAWEKGDDTIRITGSLLKDLMFDGFIDDQIIDWYSYHLQRRESSDTIKSMIFLSLTWTSVRDGMKHLEKRYLVDIINTINYSTQLLLFPMNSSKTAAAKDGFHWTLLVLDCSVWEWRHYNSMMPRGQKRNNKFVTDAREMKKRVTEVINSRLASENIEPMDENSEINIMDCPQQGHSVDCALYVCKFMDYLVHDRDLPTSFSKETMGRDRAMWTYEILSDPPRSWSLVDSKDDHMAKENTLKSTTTNED